MSESFEMTGPDRFTTGTVGEPGQRVFYVQATEIGSTVTLKLEKAQVAALAQYMAELLADLPTVPDEEVPDDIELVEPLAAVWVVGTMGVAFDEQRDRMVVTFQELVPEEEEDVATPDAGLMTVVITRPQAMAFVRRAAELVASGRPPCTLCGRPLDSEGHVCIKTNGQLH